MLTFTCPALRSYAILLLLCLRAFLTQASPWPPGDPLSKAIAISGRVLNVQGEGLPGVNVIEKGTQNGTSTDANGRFKISVRDIEAVLVFSSVGYISTEEKVGSRTQLTLTMADAEKTLDQVVVVGYGTQRRQDVTGSVGSVAIKDLQSIPLPSVDQGLAGRVAGVQVTQNSGAPGAGTTIRVRGGNSVNASNEPLYVIDGFPIVSQQDRDLQGGPGTNPLANINPNDIENIEILKDASATAIYGARGANGVVLITTKAGKRGDKGRIEFEVSQGVQQVARQLDLLDARQYLTLRQESLQNVNQPVEFTPAQVDSLVGVLGRGTNWQDQIFRKATIQNYQLSFWGGSPKSTYFVSTNYFTQKGVIINSGLERLSLRVNFTTDISDRLQVGVNATVNRVKNQTIASDNEVQNNTPIVRQALLASPLISPYRADQQLNSFIDDPRLGEQEGFFVNPLVQIYGTQSQQSNIQTLGNLFLNYELIPNLRFRTTFGWDFGSKRTNFYANSQTASGRFDGGTAQIQSIQNVSFLNENTLNYARTFSNLHKVDLLAGFTYQTYLRENFLAGTQRFANDNLGWNDLASGSVLLTPQSSTTDWRLISYLGRFNYGFKNRYLFTLTGRVDGSSRFAQNNKYAFFPSAAVAWRAIEEPFIRDLNVFDDLKVRASWGQTGNQAIDPYQSLASYSSLTTPFNTQLATGYVPTRLANPNLKWERTGQFDIGVDVGFWKNRATLTVDYYSKATTDLLFNKSVPSSSGYNFIFSNIGKVTNQGFELSVNVRPVNGAFTWSIGGNLSANRNKVVNVGSAADLPIGGTSGFLNLPNPPMILREGQPLGTFYGLEWQGVWQKNEVDAATRYKTVPGELKYRDVNGDTLINDLDRVLLGSAQPKFIFGLSNTFTYKGFELNVFLQGVQGNKILNMTKNILGRNNGGQGTTELLDRWTADNPSNTVPRANRGRLTNSVSGYLLEDGSFLRLKNIALSYRLPASFLSRYKVAGIRLFVTAQNVLTFTKYSGLDPEVSRFGSDNLRQGIDQSGYPQVRTFNAGINITL